MSIDTLEQALVEELKDIYDAEQQLLEALPLLADKATNPELKAGFEEHLKQTEGHVARLEQVFELLEEEAERETCRAMQGLIRESNHIMKEKAEPEVMDAFLIAAAQKVEHYEIASYGTVCTWAKAIGRNDVKKILAETLKEEKLTDEKLSNVAEKTVNLQAV